MNILTVHQSKLVCKRFRIEQQVQRCVFIHCLSAAQRNNTHFTHLVLHSVCFSLMQSELLIHKVIKPYLSPTGVFRAPPIRTRTRNNLIKVLLLRDMTDQKNFTATQSNRRINYYPSHMIIH